MIVWPEKEARKTVDKLVDRASVDPAFRRLAVESPHEAVRLVAGHDLPEGFRMAIIEPDGRFPNEMDMLVVLSPFRGENSAN